MWISFWQEIGEEFVEFLEKELNITDQEIEANKGDEGTFNSSTAKRTESGMNNEAGKASSSSIEDNIDEIEATLAKLKKELGL